MSEEVAQSIGFTLVQRLDIPRGGPFPKAFGPFGAFGSGGFSQEGLDVLGKIWDFHYQGAAEYETGACPRALATMWAYAGEKKLRHGTLKIPGCRRYVYYICNRNQEVAVKRAIQKLAAGERRMRSPEEMAEVVTRDYVGLHDALRSHPRKPGETVGWLDVDHAYMFFVNRTMYNKTLQLFVESAREFR